MIAACRNYCGISIYASPSTQTIEPEHLAWMTKIIEIPRLNSIQRKILWQEHLATTQHTLLTNDSEAISTQFICSGTQIKTAFSIAHLIAKNLKKENITKDILEQACQFIIHKSFDGLTQTTHSSGAKRTQLILPEKQDKIFESILSAAKNHERVLHEWGFEQHLVTGRGLCILFDGPPGTGKTFVSEVLANELNRPLE